MSLNGNHTRPAGQVRPQRRCAAKRGRPAIPGDTIDTVPILSLLIHHLNPTTYASLNVDHPRVVELAADILATGKIDPIRVTTDDYIISGNTRWLACRRLGKTEVPIIREEYDSDDPRFARDLVALNNQRVKTVEEILREEVVRMAVDPDEAHDELRAYRRQRVEATIERANPLVLGARRKRDGISKAKRPMLDKILAIIDENSDFWPLTNRYIHYQLLNHFVLRHASKPDSAYRNDDLNYRDLNNLLTRARITGEIDPAAIDDPSRPVTNWNCYPHTGPFIREQLNDLFKDYHRDLQLAQPCHVELILEKQTLQQIVRPVAAEYRVPLTIGKGYASLAPRVKLVERFRQSQKDKLILVFVSDFDPEGEDLARAFGRSLRDDLRVPEGQIDVVKAALTRDQVGLLGLSPRMIAKEDSSRRAAFVEANGENVFELEAVPAPRLQDLVQQSIESVLDMDLFRAELKRERDDAVVLKRYREMFRRVPMSADDPNHDHGRDLGDRPTE